MYPVSSALAADGQQGHGILKLNNNNIIMMAAGRA